MEILEFNSINDILNKEDTCAVLGSFDGIHLGHQKLLKHLDNTLLKKAMITFNPNPKAFFTRGKFHYLTPILDKIAILKDKLDYLFIINFNREFADSSKAEYISFLKNNMVKEVICGFDYTFGKNKEGKASDLSDFKLFIEEPFQIDSEKVSSTSIRKSLNIGDINKANKFLGRYYSISGKVIYGSRLGRTIGFPTANIEQNDYYIPKNGVYLTKTIYNDKVYKSMTNIGNNPTFNYQDDKRIETYILDLNKEIYGEEIKIEFIERIRDEVKFSSKEELIAELTRNAQYVKESNIV